MSALGQKQTCAVQNVMSALPPTADMCIALAHVRFVPTADIRQTYSITSSARNRTSGGTVSPSWPAVLRFKTNSNRVGNSIGRTAGLVPCRIFAAITPARRYWARRFGP